MGKQIVYCVGCGNSLREEDFSEGEAVVVENRPYCSTCRPKNVPTETPSRPHATPKTPARKTSTARIPAPRPGSQRKTGTGRVPLATPADRRRPVPARRQTRNGPLIIGGVVLAVAFVLLMLTVLMRREPPAAPTDDPPAKTEPAPAPK